MVTFAQAQPGIFAGESGGDYNALYGYQNRPGGRFANTRLTDMSVGDVMQFTDPRGDYAAYVRGQVGRTATPVGAYQVVGTTLRGAVDALGIDPSTPFNQATQDRIGEWIFNTQGTGAWEGYRGPQAGGQGMDQGMMGQGFVAQEPQDPMANLTRSQRMMLGFAALRDAAASLEGQQSSFFNDAFSGIQTRQLQQQQLDIRRAEQERLRRQGDMENQIAALGRLREIEGEIAQYSVLGREVPANLLAMRDILNQSLAGLTGGAPASSAAAVTPVSGGAAIPPAVAPTPAVTPSATPAIGAETPPAGQEAPAPSSDRLARTNAEIARLTELAGLPGMEFVNDRLDALYQERTALIEEQEAATEASLRARPEATASSIAIREADKVLLDLGFDPETGERVGGSSVAGPTERTAVDFFGGAGEVAYAGSRTLDFLNTLQSLRDTVAIQRLLEIKQSGAGLGQIPQSQLDALGRQLGTLKPSLSDEQLARNVYDIRRLYNDIVQTSLADSQDETFRTLIPNIAFGAGGATPEAPQPAAPSATGGATHRFNPETGLVEVIQ